MRSMVRLGVRHSGRDLCSSASKGPLGMSVDRRWWRTRRDEIGGKLAVYWAVGGRLSSEGGGGIGWRKSSICSILAWAVVEGGDRGNGRSSKQSRRRPRTEERGPERKKMDIGAEVEAGRTVG